MVVLNFLGSKMKKIVAVITLCLMLFPFQLVNAGDAKLTGSWKGASSSVSLVLRANGTYRYKLKLLDISGRWHTAGNKLILHYKMLGIKKKKVSSYRFEGKDLMLKSDGRKEVRLKKVK
jgi:hypothetical protein